MSLLLELGTLPLMYMNSPGHLIPRRCLLGNVLMISIRVIIGEDPDSIEDDLDGFFMSSLGFFFSGVSFLVMVKVFNSACV